jgi:large conductance mechanosensitive channel
MGMLHEFKEFAVRGSVVDMAVGIVIGGAFGGIVNSLVKDVIMPPIGWLSSRTDFSSWSYKLPVPADSPDKAVTINYGLFMNAVINFVIVAFAIFLLVKLVNALRRKQEAAPAAPTAQEKLLIEIRDLLKAR